MKYVLPLTIIVLFVAFNGVSDAFSEDLIISAEPTSQDYEVGIFPTIKGTVVNGQEEPVSGVYVYALFPNQKIDTTSKADGSFYLRLPERLDAGEYSVDVYARTNTVLARANISFEVHEPAAPEKPSWVTNSTLAKSKSPIGEMMLMLQSRNNTTDYNVILEQIEIQKQEEETRVIKKNTFTSHMELVENQRALTKYNLEQDLLENTREIQVEANRNAFASFVSDVDSLMRMIFWDQFDFTQQKSNEGYEAKMSALEEGQTSQEAMKAYQNKAASSQQEILSYMEELNIKHGFSNSTIQEKFDENGKLPRNGQGILP